MGEYINTYETCCYSRKHKRSSLGLVEHKFSDFFTLVLKNNLQSIPLEEAAWLAPQEGVRQIFFASLLPFSTLSMRTRQRILGGLNSIGSTLSAGEAESAPASQYQHQCCYWQCYTVCIERNLM